MDHIARFGLEFNPFLKNSKEILVENEESHEVRWIPGIGLLSSLPDSPVKQYPAPECA